jgi:oligoribonuclease
MTDFEYSPYIFWCDCEMTGLNINQDELIEIAGLVTDWNLNILDQGFSLVIKPSESALITMPNEVKKMHEANGLLAALADGIAVTEAENHILKYLQNYETRSGKMILAGNSIHSDRKFIDQQMPKLSKFLHYRLLDVSTIKILAQAWYSQVSNQLHKNHSHRALDDIAESIKELSYYRERIFQRP